MIRFTKMHGLGNDYLFVEATADPPDDPADLTRRMSDRHRGAGADGLILVLPPLPGVDADLRMRIFNADGSEAEMCGNGIRCLCKYACDRGLCRRNPLRVQTGAGVLALHHAAGADGRVERVTVDMGTPRCRGAERYDRGPWLEIDRGWPDRSGWDLLYHQVSLGNPHVVLHCRDVSAVPLASLGPRIEQDAMFPGRTNVHFVQVHDAGTVTVRTWERGSGATLACGTGAAAVCVAGAAAGRHGPRVEARLPGGVLLVEWDRSADRVLMTGPAREVYTGYWVERRD